MKKVEDALGDAPDRSARFVCALALAWPDGHVETFEGTVDGTLVWPPRGTHGFGYDPTFLPTGGSETFGEMDPDRKHAISHRADAFRNSSRAASPGVEFTMGDLALYIHWPFCLSKCPYCDFNSHVRESIDESRWCRALLTELDTTAAALPAERLAASFSAVARHP